MFHWTLSAVTGAALLTLGTATAPQDPISGAYFLDEGRSDDFFQAIDNGIAINSFASRDLARKLRKAAVPSYAISISFSEGRFSIKNDAKPVIVVQPGGESTKWKIEDGQVFDVSAKADGEAVALTFRAPDSERTTVYRGGGQQLMAETMITSPLIPAPIRYKSVYNRAN